MSDESRRVLIIDDEKDLVDNLALILESCDYVVETAHDPRGAFDQIGIFDANVVLIDVRLGNENGLNLISKLQEVRPNAIPIIMTAYAETDSAIEAFQEGAFDYLRKPLDPKKLLKILERCFEKLQLEKEKLLAQRALGIRNKELETINAKLKESEERYRILVETINDGLVMQDQSDIIIWTNKNLCVMTGYSKEEIIGKRIQDFLDGKNREIYREKMYNILRERVAPYELAWKNKEGDSFYTLVSPRAILNRNGTPTGILSVITDISVQKTAEKNRREMEAQLLQAQKMEGIGTLAGGIAHDFNNALQSILGYAQILLLDAKDNSSIYNMLSRIEKSALNASELTQQLLAFSRKVESKMKPTNVNHEVREVEKIVRRTILKMIDIELHLEEDLNVINADPSQLEQIMINLMVNARDAVGKSGKISILTKNVTLNEDFCRNKYGYIPGEYVSLSVSDNGSGMTKADQERIFEPFFTTKGVGKGTGLGLSIVYGLVKKHNGFIECHSEPDEGTTFRIYFPVIEHDIEDNIEKGEEYVFQGGSETVLIVDDESLIREFGEQILTRFGYNVVAAADGESALDIYANRRDEISLVILDLIMPGMGGEYCLMEMMRINPEVKIIVASGYTQDGDGQSIVEKGASGYISKPYEAKRMLKTVREVLDNRK